MMRSYPSVRTLRTVVCLCIVGGLAACAASVQRPPVDPTQQHGMSAEEVEGHIQACMAIANDSTGQGERTANSLRVVGGALVGSVIGGIVSDDPGKGIAAGAAAGGATTAGVGLLTTKPGSRADVIVVECLKGRGISVLGEVS